MSTVEDDTMAVVHPQSLEARRREHLESEEDAMRSYLFSKLQHKLQAQRFRPSFLAPVTAAHESSFLPESSFMTRSNTSMTSAAPGGTSFVTRGGSIRTLKQATANNAALAAVVDTADIDFLLKQMKKQHKAAAQQRQHAITVERRSDRWRHRLEKFFLEEMEERNDLEVLEELRRVAFLSKYRSNGFTHLWDVQKEETSCRSDLFLESIHESFLLLSSLQIESINFDSSKLSSVNSPERSAKVHDFTSPLRLRSADVKNSNNNRRRKASQQQRGSSVSNAAAATQDNNTIFFHTVEESDEYNERIGLEDDEDASFLTLLRDARLEHYLISEGVLFLTDEAIEHKAMNSGARVQFSLFPEAVADIEVQENEEVAVSFKDDSSDRIVAKVAAYQATQVRYVAEKEQGARGQVEQQERNEKMRFVRLHALLFKKDFVYRPL